MSKVPCQICGREFKRITKAHLAMHGVSYEQYRKDYPDSPMLSDETRQSLQNSLQGNQRGKGYKHTDESRARMSVSRQGKNRGGYRKREISPDEITVKFLKQLQRGTEDQCWEWQGTRNNKGYGGFKIRELNEDQTSNWVWVGTHRFAYELWTGKIPEGRLVLHHCDNPPCCNPKHLWLGDYADNLKDAETKGRKEPLKPMPGITNPEAFLTENEVRAIRLSAARKTQQEIAAFFGISQSHVSAIIHRRSWAHIE